LRSSPPIRSHLLLGVQAAAGFAIYNLDLAEADTLSRRNLARIAIGNPGRALGQSAEGAEIEPDVHEVDDAIRLSWDVSNNNGIGSWPLIKSDTLLGKCHLLPLLKDLAQSKPPSECQPNQGSKSRVEFAVGSQAVIQGPTLSAAATCNHRASNSVANVLFLLFYKGAFPFATSGR
jgi:hypothetical protein